MIAYLLCGIAGAVAGSILTAIGIAYLVYLSHERFRKSHTKGNK